MLIRDTVYRFWALGEAAHRVIVDTVCNHGEIAASRERQEVDSIALAVATKAPDGTSTARGLYCHDARECLAAAFSLLRQVDHATCLRDQRPSCIPLKPDVLTFR